MGVVKGVSNQEGGTDLSALCMCVCVTSVVERINGLGLDLRFISFFPKVADWLVGIISPLSLRRGT